LKERAKNVFSKTLASAEQKYLKTAWVKTPPYLARKELLPPNIPLKR
jgi:hypothetical protein